MSTDDLMTMAQVARKLGGDEPIPESTLYQVIAELEREHPGVVWYRKIGRHRRFTEEDYGRLVEAFGCRSNLSRQAGGKATSTGTSEEHSTESALNALRKRRLSELRKDSLKASPAPSASPRTSSARRLRLVTP
jgi:hypothetical protein